MNQNNVNLIAAIAISILIVVGWQYFYERPRIAEAAQAKKQYDSQIQQIKNSQMDGSALSIVPREEAVIKDKRVHILSETLHGSISLRGARFDDLTLNLYKQTVDPNSKDVDLLSPSHSPDSYFAELGWRSNTEGITMPSSNTIFSADKDEIKPGENVKLNWTNPENIEFIFNIGLDENYMFTIEQSVVNKSTKPITIQSYGLINRNYNEQEKAVQILHQGPIAVINDELFDMSFDTLKDKKAKHDSNVNLSWIGITDKYWLTAFIPDQKTHYNVNFLYAISNAHDKFQVDFISPTEILEQNATYTTKQMFFAGAKKVGLLDKYESEYNIKLFDRAIDFGMFYVLTKPLFNALNFFYKYCGNFGISILIVTIIIKLLMFTMANKSYKSMKQMKALQPEIERLKALYADDKARFNQEIMELYKKKKVNPVAGCLPMLVQIPVFFSLYKVLYVTIEMRQAPFFGWIHDLSAPDPTTLFNLFGLLSFTPPSFLMIGIWPLLMAATMYLQQRMSPEPSDPMQAQAMKLMPVIFLFMFSNFPAGLLIYWTWNNILSMVQQYYINNLSK